MRLVITTRGPYTNRMAYNANCDGKWEVGLEAKGHHAIRVSFRAYIPDEQWLHLLAIGKKSAAHNHLRSRVANPDRLTNRHEILVRGLPHPPNSAVTGTLLPCHQYGYQMSSHTRSWP